MDPVATPAAASLPRRTLMLGGARSGKSAAAQRLMGDEPAVTYLATGPRVDGSDPEWGERVRRHREQRPFSWTTTESMDPAGVLRAATAPVLLDCLGTWLTSVLTDTGAWESRAGWEELARARVADFLESWRHAAAPVVAVSNEVGSGVVPAYPSGILFRDWLGRLNQDVAAASDRVMLVVAGRTLELS